MELTISAPAKLNLRLRVVGRRDDGMHLVEGESVLINLADKVTLTARADGKIVRDWQHPDVAAEDDLTVRAAHLLAEKCGVKTKGATIRVEKNIPVGGGLGGGSSNAAAVLRGLNDLWQCRLPPADLMELSAALGADVPFFVGGRAAKIGGVGAPVAPLSPPPAFYLLVFPPVVARTAAVYAEYEKLQTPKKKSPQKPPLLVESGNDLAQAAMQLYPPISDAAAALRQAAGRAHLSGSGAALFAAFASEDAARRAQAALPSGLPSATAATLSNGE